MEIKERKLKGVFEIQLQSHVDERGFFMRTFDSNIFEEAGLNRNWVQENHSLSKSKGIVRGLHLQFPPYSETKLVRCIVGSVLDVFVDLREGSRTFGAWDSIELSAENKRQIFIPRGFAHGFCTLTEVSEVVYKVDNFYSKEHEIGVLWNDTQLDIAWPLFDHVLSKKDAGNMFFQDFINKFKSIKV